MSKTRQWLRQVIPRPVLQRLKKWYYPRVLRKFDEKDWPGAVIVKNLIEPGDTVVDAGANIGYVSMLLAAWVGPTGRVCSFEPVPDTYGILQNNMRRLGLSRVETYPFAVSSHQGRAEMEVPRYDTGGENLYEARLLEKGAAPGDLRKFSVELRRLDDIIDPSWPVSFIKMDVEGHEWDAILGAALTLKIHQPSLMIEVNGDPNEPESPSGRLFAFLVEQGYQPYWWDGTDLKHRTEKDQHVDYFFLTSSHLKKLAARGFRL